LASQHFESIAVEMTRGGNRRRAQKQQVTLSPVPPRAWKSRSKNEARDFHISTATAAAGVQTKNG